MWPFSKRAKPSVEDRAALAATFLLDSLPDITAVVLKAAKGPEWRQVVSDDLYERMSVEVLVFELHLADRLSFVKMKGGAKEREDFAEALMPLIREQLPTSLQDSFKDFYNSRQQYYGAFKTFSPKDGEPAGGTLFWEFGKKVLVDTKAAPDITAMLELGAAAGNMLRGIDGGYTQLGVYGY